MWQVHPVALTSLTGKLKEPMNFTEPKGTGYFRCKISGQLTGSSQYHQKKKFEFIVITQRRQRVMKREEGEGGSQGLIFHSAIRIPRLKMLLIVCWHKQTSLQSSQC